MQRSLLLWGAEVFFRETVELITGSAFDGISAWYIDLTLQRCHFPILFPVRVAPNIASVYAPFEGIGDGNRVGWYFTFNKQPINPDVADVHGWIVVACVTIVVPVFRFGVFGESLCCLFITHLLLGETRCVGFK